MHTSVCSSYISWCPTIICTSADMWDLFNVYLEEQNQMCQNVNNQ